MHLLMDQYEALSGIELLAKGWVAKRKARGVILFLPNIFLPTKMGFLV